MYNILLTDDEQIVIDSLSFIISKNFENQVNIHTALSGTKALEIVTKNNIDIIFMDINMPGLNGLETVDCIKKIRPETIVIILSAFDKFQYAQEAMNLGAFKYITKPVNRNIVIQTVKQAMDTIEIKKSIQNKDLELNKKMDLFSPMLENDFIYSCAFNFDKNVDLSSYLDYFNIPDLAWCFCCFQIPNVTSENQNSFYTKIRDIVNEKQRCLTSTFIANRIIVYYPVYSLENNLTDSITEIYKNICFKVSQGVRAGISKIYTDKNLVSDSYSEALSNLYRTDAEGGICFSSSTENPVSNQKESETEFKNQLLIKIKQGDTNSVTAYTNLLCSQIISEDTNINLVKNKFFEIIVNAFNIVKELIPAYTNQEYENVFENLSKEQNFNSLKDFLLKMLLEFTSSINKIRSQMENPVIEKVCLYIQKNMKEDISLEQMADYANISSFYLSKLFKEEKGVSFINYLTDIRLDKAKELLQNHEYSIKEITAIIGYNDQNYFSRLFKNKFGISPSEYRNSL